MKKTITTLTLTLTCLVSASAQTSLTNTASFAVSNTGMYDNKKKSTVHEISAAYGVRIGFEDSSTPSELFSAAFTNATLEHVLTTVMAVNTNHVWQYDGSTDFVNIRLAENSITTQRYERVSITNTPLYKIIFGDDDMLGFRKNRFWLEPSRGRTDWWETEITLEMEDVSLAEVLNAICLQLPLHGSWTVFRVGINSDRFHNQVWFHYR